MTTEMNSKVIELLPGKLYMAEGDVAKEDIIRDEYFAGATDGKVTVTIREKVYKVRDSHGSAVFDIRYGAGTEIRGKLVSITPRTVCLLLGGREGEFILPDRPRERRVSACFVYPTAEGDDTFSMYFRCATGDQNVLALDSANEDGVAFTLSCENSLGKKSAAISFGDAGVVA